MPHFPEESTADGSQTFYSPEFGEWFHSRGGAYDEARQTYVQATNLVARAQAQGHLVILDVCYGLGYNTAAALEALWQVGTPLFPRSRRPRVGCAGAPGGDRSRDVKPMAVTSSSRLGCSSPG
jgi:hypothetical protein